MKSGTLYGTACGQNHIHPDKGIKIYLRVLGSTLSVLMPIEFVVKESSKLGIYSCQLLASQGFPIFHLHC